VELAAVTGYLNIQTIPNYSPASGFLYFIEILIRRETNTDGSTYTTAYLYAYDYTSDSWIGETDATICYSWSTNPVYLGFGAWTDSSSNPSSDYWLNIPSTVGITSSQTSPLNHYVTWSRTYGTYGPDWIVSTTGAKGDYNYAFYAYNRYLNADNMTVPASGKILVQVFATKSGTFSSTVACGRSYEKLHILGMKGNILDSAQVLTCNNNNGQWYALNWTFGPNSNYPAGTMVKIGFGRDNYWSTDWSLQASAAQLLATPG
jgi:hypothetical protein